MKHIQHISGVKPINLLFAGILSCFWALNACTEMDGRAASAEAEKAPSVNGQQKMLSSLGDISRKINIHFNGYAAEAKLAYFDSLLMVARTPTDKGNAMLKKGLTLLEYGDEANAVLIFEEVLQSLGNASPQGRAYTLYWLGTAHLRLGERNNCVAGHTAEACIMPLKGSGIHKDKTGSSKAIETFETLLTEFAKEEKYTFDALWMLNICYMTLGEYPQKVPQKWLIPNLDAADYPMNPFVDMATDLKIMVNNRAGGSIVDDFDQDGDLDLVTSGWDLGVESMHFFTNSGDGTFKDQSVNSGLNVFKGGLNIQQTDYNNDGYLDIWVLRGAWQGGSDLFGEQPNSLLRNNKDGTFTDVTIEAGLLSFRPTQAATWNDFNHDGWLDVFIGNESMPNGNLYPCELYINNQDGTFKNVAAEWGLNINMFAKAVGSGDYDNDGWADIFISSMDGRKLLLRNKGVINHKIEFENVTDQAGFGKEKYRSFPTFFFDYDNDGWLDIFVCSYEFERTLAHYFAREALRPSNDQAGKPQFYHNNKDGTFTNLSSSIGVNKPAFAMAANFGDFNNDGFLDIYMGTGNPSYQSIVPNKLLMNVGGKKFADATTASRTGNLQKGHGVSIADMDNDGDQDIHVEMGGAYRGDHYPTSLYMNPGQNNNNWIYLKLEGTKSNRAAIGTKITLKFQENGKRRMVYRELNSGGSFGSSPLRREIGVGQATVIDEISIFWPASGITQVLKNITPNQCFKIKEGQEGFEVVDLHKITFKKADGSIPMCLPTK